MRWALLFFLLSPSSLEAVLLNEIAWMGSQVPDADPSQYWRYEFLELFNEEDAAVGLAGWSVEFYRGQELYHAIPLEGEIQPQGYVLAGASEKIPGVDVNYSNLGGKLLNDGMRVVLRSEAGIAADEVDSSEGWPAGDNASKRTMERSREGWQTSALPGGTPGAENSAGLKEEDALSPAKKDPGGPFSQLFAGVSTLPLLPALLLSLGLAALSLGLRRLLSRRA